MTYFGCLDKYVSKWSHVFLFLGVGEGEEGNTQKCVKMYLGNFLILLSGSDKTFKPDTEQSQ